VGLIDGLLGHASGVDAAKVQAPLFYATHPRLSERIATYEEMLRTEFRERRGGMTNAAVFREKTSRVVIDSAWMDLRAGRFDAARQSGERYLARKPNDARGHYVLAETLRQQGERAVALQAIPHYLKAIAVDRSYSDAHKGLGLVHFQLGEKPQARRALETYLSISPQANDRAYIEEYIRLCR